MILLLLLFKQKTAYEMRISDWSSDVCSSDLLKPPPGVVARAVARGGRGQACPPSAADLSCPGAGPVEAPASHRAGLAQLVEHLICNQGVAGSNPAAGTTT